LLQIDSERQREIAGSVNLRYEPTAGARLARMRSCDIELIRGAGHGVHA
jgi:hypothetical protein